MEILETTAREIILEALKEAKSVYNYKLCANEIKSKDSYTRCMLTLFREAKNLEEEGLVTVEYINGRNRFRRGPTWEEG